MNYGFVKVASAIPTTRVADCTYNTQQIKSLLVEAEDKGVQVVTFPELCITGYTCGNLFLQETLQRSALNALNEVAEYTQGMNLIAIVGLPLMHYGRLYNVAAVIHNGEIEGLVSKCAMGDNPHFFSSPLEKKFFPIGEKNIPFGSHLLFNTPALNFAIEVGNSGFPPSSTSSRQIMADADVIFNPTAYREIVGNHEYMKTMLKSESARNRCGYVSASCGYGESTTDLVYSGGCFIYENGELLAEGKRFCMKSQLVISDIDIEHIRHERIQSSCYDSLSYNELPSYEEVTITPKSQRIKLTRAITPTPFIPQGEALETHCFEVFNIQVTGLCRRIEHTYSKAAVIGISGGLDSTLALLVSAKAFDQLGRSRKEIIGVTMPGFGTTDRTYHNAIDLMKALGVTIREISIKEACLQHFSDIGHDVDNHDVTYENSQARERTQILMDVANQVGGMVIGTGDLSELALGWATYNGDHMSMYGVNASVPKTLIQKIVCWIADNALLGNEAGNILHDIVDTPISPELIPADEQGNIKQKTEDLVGPYELHDFFLYHFVRHGSRPQKIYDLAQQAFDGKYSDEVIRHWLTTFCRRFFNQQFKRSCLPDGPKVGSVSLSPRGDWQMPSDACSTEWLKDITN